jgi:hypothetical protein
VLVTLARLLIFALWLYPDSFRLLPIGEDESECIHELFEMISRYDLYVHNILAANQTRESLVNDESHKLSFL